MAHYKKVLRSVISYLPVFNGLLSKTGTGGSNEAEYCINIWEKHYSEFIKWSKNDLNVVAEVGPGDSLGVGICALLEGAEKYLALDSIKHASIENNISTLNAVVENYLRNKKPINLDKIPGIKSAIVNNNNSSSVQYYVPWWEFNIIEENKVDFIFSTAVLEHVTELESFYKKAYEIMASGGIISSIIDYGAHEFSKDWFRHYYYSNWYWRFLMHGRKYPINRVTHSHHIKLMKNVGFEVVHESRKKSVKANKDRICSSIVSMFRDEDLDTRSGLIIARKK